MLHRIPSGKTGLIDWLALYTTAEVKKLRKDGQLVKTEDEYLVITGGGLWRVEYVGDRKKKEAKEHERQR